MFNNVSSTVRACCYGFGTTIGVLTLIATVLRSDANAQLEPLPRVDGEFRIAQSSPPAERDQAAAPSAVPASPWGILNVLRHSVGSGLQASEMLPVPTGPGGAPAAAPPGNHLIPFAQPEDVGDVEVDYDRDLVSLTVRDALLRHVVALVAETQNLNIVFATPADTRVTAAFDRMPWQRVLDSLLAASGHAWTTHGDVIFVTSFESASAVALGASGRVTRVFELDFASAADVDQGVQGLLSPAGLAWVLETSSSDNRRTREAVVVVDYPGNIAGIEDYIVQVDQPPRQVLIEANILQVELQDDCRNGVNFQALAASLGKDAQLRAVGFANAAASPAVFLEASGGALTGLVEALKSTSDAKTLASPKLLALNGQQAQIQIGEQLGFRVTTTTQTSSLESVQFLNVGVVLTVTPRITRDGHVMMRIKPKVSTGEVSPETGLPSEKTTEVETDVIVSTGQGVVIGGLIQERDINTQTKFPWLGDLPYAGILFQRRQVVKSRAEIVVTLMPHVMPYSPNVECREQHEFMRTQDRLTTGPLCRVPRPYEPRLPDTFTNPKWGFRPRECRECPETYVEPHPVDHAVSPPVFGPPDLTPTDATPSEPVEPTHVEQAQRAAPRRY